MMPISGTRPAWLNLCGQWGGDTFYADGRIDSGGAEIGRMRLTLEDGSELEDDGTGGVALFTGRCDAPAESVDIYAPDGALLSSRKAP